MLAVRRFPRGLKKGRLEARCSDRRDQIANAALERIGCPAAAFKNLNFHDFTWGYAAPDRSEGRTPAVTIACDSRIFRSMSIYWLLSPLYPTAVRRRHINITMPAFCRPAEENFMLCKKLHHAAFRCNDARATV